jgi:hypothetical protein
MAKNYNMQIFTHVLNEKNLSLDQNLNPDPNPNLNPSNNCDKPEDTNINLPHYPETNAAIFMSTVLFSIIYTIIVLNRYSALCIPRDIKLHEDVFKRKDATLNELLKTYNTFGVFLPSVVLWKNKNDYFIHPSLSSMLKKCSARFIMIKISLIPFSNSTHANVLIIDTKSGIVDRFDPYGYYPVLDTNILDDILEEIITTTFSTTNIKYLRYDNVAQSIVGVQTISQDDNIKYKKASDPVGYCLAWVFWYVELRMSNPDVHPRKLILNATKMIIASMNVSTDETNSDEDNSMINVSLFGNYIRNYAHALDTDKNAFLKAAGIDHANYYNNVYSDNDYKKIVHKINSTFELEA